MLKRTIASLFTAVVLSGAAATANTASAQETYKIDPAHAFVYYKTNHFGWSNNMGRFNKVSGTFTINEKDPSKSKVEVTIDAASIDTNHEARDKHLRSPDFFNVKAFPTIKFVSTKIEKTGDRTGKITGNLTILGVTKPVTFDFTWNKRSPHFRNKDRIHSGFSAQLKINRADWGMQKFPAQAIGHEITLFLEIEGIKQ
jgi:polyisoprenoid-binding protein YceI